MRRVHRNQEKPCRAQSVDTSFTKRDEKSTDFNQNNKYMYFPPISCVAWKHILELDEILCYYKLRVFLNSSHNSYFVLLGSVHIPAVLCYVVVSTCSSILNVYVASG